VVSEYSAICQVTTVASFYESFQRRVALVVGTPGNPTRARQIVVIIQHSPVRYYPPLERMKASKAIIRQSRIHRVSDNLLASLSRANVIPCQNDIFGDSSMSIINGFLLCFRYVFTCACPHTSPAVKRNGKRVSAPSFQRHDPQNRILDRRFVQLIPSPSYTIHAYAYACRLAKIPAGLTFRYVYTYDLRASQSVHSNLHF